MFFLLRLILAALLLTPMFVFAQHSHEEEHPTPYITNIWMLPTADTLNIVNMRIENSSDQAFQLEKVSTPLTQTATLSGRPGFNILNPGDFIVFGARTEAYLTLRDLEEELVTGDAFTLTLTFVMLDENGEATDETFDVFVGVPVLDEAPQSSHLIFINPWVRPTLAEMPEEAHDHHATPEVHNHTTTTGSVTGGFMQILNTRDETETLVSASSDAATMVEIHETVLNGDLMRMQNVEGGLEIPAGEMIEFKSGGYHLMVHLKKDLAPGETVLITFTFESGFEQTIAVPVYDRAFMLLSN